MRNLPQSNITNPAFMPKYKVSTGIPALNSNYIDFGISSLKWKDFMSLDNNDSLHFSKDDFLSHLNSNNYFTSSYENILVYGGYRINSWYFNVSATEKASIQFAFPKDLFSFLLEGNGNHIGSTLNLDGIGFDMTHYREYALGLAKRSNKLTLGAKLKVLYGMSNVQTERSSLSLHTKETTFDLTTSANFKVKSSLPIDDFDAGEYLFNTKNQGYAVDFGFDYKVNKRVSIAGSMIDNGYIYWTSNVHNYNVDGIYTFSGLDINDLILQKEDETESNIFDDLVEDLDSIFAVTEDSSFYQSKLSSKYYLSGKYRISDSDELGILFFGNYFNKQFRPSFTIFYSQENDQIFNSSISYSIINGNFMNIGVGTSIKGGPFQAYFLFDNLAGIIFPQSANNTNFRFGFNLVFGKAGEKKEKKEKASKDAD